MQTLSLSCPVSPSSSIQPSILPAPFFAFAKGIFSARHRMGFESHKSNTMAVHHGLLHLSYKNSSSMPRICPEKCDISSSLYQADSSSVLLKKNSIPKPSPYTASQSSICLPLQASRMPLSELSHQDRGACLRVWHSLQRGEAEKVWLKTPCFFFYVLKRGNVRRWKSKH
jgi:hypothetical protein